MISNRKYENNYTNPNLFKSIVKCKKCGRTLTFCYNQRKTTKRVYKYACMGRYLGDKDIHESVSISYSDLEQIVTTRLKALMESIKNKGDAFIEDIISSIDIDSESKQLDVQKSKIESRLNVIAKAMKKLYEDNVCERITDENYQMLLTDFQKEQKELNRKLEELTTKNNKYNTQFERIKEFRKIADKYLNFEELTNEIVHSLIDHIEIDVNTIDNRKIKEINIIYRFICQIIFKDNQDYDVETDLFLVSSCYYNPEWGRWISPDDIEYLDPESINGLNLYCYCYNDPINYCDPSGHSAILIGLIIGAIVGAGIGFGTAAYIDYQDDGQIFNGSVAWYDYLGATVLGGAVGAGLGAGIGAFAGMSFSFSIPTFGLVNTGGALAFGVTGKIGLSVTGAQILGAAGLIGATYMFASTNRPGNNRAQNKQFENAARAAGYNPKDPRIRDVLNQIHQYIRKNKLNLGWKELLELIKEWLG